MRSWSIPSLVLLVGLGIAAGPVSVSGAAPVWKFNSSELTGAESIAGGAGKSSWTATGISISCEELSYGMTVSNEGGNAKGSLNEMSFEGCSTKFSECLIESMVAEKLPWQVRGKMIKSIGYILFEGVKFTVEFVPNDNCVLNEVALTFTGTAGGRYDNANGSFEFDSAAFTATGTSIKAIGAPFEWSSAFTTKALGSHAGQVLELK